MSSRDDPFTDDAYGEPRRDPYGDSYGEQGDEPGGQPRPARRHATQPARPAWDAMTYGRPDDVRPPPRRTPPPTEPEPAPGPYRPEPDSPYGSPPYGSSSYGSSSHSSSPHSSSPHSSSPHSSSPYSSSPYSSSSSSSDSSYGYSPAYAPPTPTPTPAPPAAAYPAASFAPEAFTSYEAPEPAPPPTAGLDEQPVYVASGLYLDESSGAPGAATPYPGGVDGATAATPVVRPSGGGGRNLPAAIGVGLALGAVVLTILFAWRPGFLGVVVVGVGAGIWELVRALRGVGVRVPLVPLLVGGAIMTGLAWWGGADGLTFGLVVTVLAAMVWRLAEGVADYGRDVSGAALVAVYVPFLGGFAAMLASPDDGHLRILAVLIAVVLCDTGGYVVGARLGRHPMAPSVSPKKSWEGLLGSLAAAALGSAVVIPLMFGAGPWWGLLFGLAIAIASIIGDLGESMLKRDLGVKDMSRLLPGHGGVMDRLDSILLAVPAGYLMLTAIAPVG